MKEIILALLHTEAKHLSGGWIRGQEFGKFTFRKWMTYQQSMVQLLRFVHQQRFLCQTVTWSASPTGIVNLSPSGNSVTVTKVTQGSVNLTATTSAGVAGSLYITTVPDVTSISPTMSGPCTNGYQSWYL